MSGEVEATTNEFGNRNRRNQRFVVFGSALSAQPVMKQRAPALGIDLDQFHPVLHGVNAGEERLRKRPNPVRGRIEK